MVTKQQGRPPSKATTTDAGKAAKANSADVERSINEWRAMQGLPPRDMSKEARNG